MVETHTSVKWRTCSRLEMLFFCACVAQVIWGTSLSWSRGDFWTSWWRSTSGRGRRRSASAASCSPCWIWFPRKEPQLPNASATHGSHRSSWRGIKKRTHAHRYSPLMKTNSLVKWHTWVHHGTWGVQANRFNIYLFLIMFRSCVPGAVWCILSFWHFFPLFCVPTASNNVLV